VIEHFRGACLARGYVEYPRTSLVSRHDPSIRFTNSTISVLKPLIEPRVSGRHFLVQPALRLRNLSHVRRTGQMSPFGCYFMAFGALAPWSSADELVDLCSDLMVAVGLSPAEYRFNAHREDTDLAALASARNVQVALDDDHGPFRHVFGVEGLSGRNINLCLRGPRGWADVANVITLERRGEIVGVELAFGTNMVLVQALGVEHPALAGPGATAASAGVDSLVAVDALHSGLALAMDGLEPVARGRGGNYRQFLRLLGAHGPSDRGLLRSAAYELAHGEADVRLTASPLPAPLRELTPAPTVDKLMSDLRRVMAAS
jgi:hypothetical protein